MCSELNGGQPFRTLNRRFLLSSFREDLGGRRYEIHPRAGFSFPITCTRLPLLSLPSSSCCCARPNLDWTWIQGKLDRIVEHRVVAEKRGEETATTNESSSTGESFEHELATLLINTAPVDYRYELNRREEGRRGRELCSRTTAGLDSSPRSFRISPPCIWHQPPRAFRPLFNHEFVLYLYPTRSSRWLRRNDLHGV